MKIKYGISGVIAIAFLVTPMLGQYQTARTGFWLEEVCAVPDEQENLNDIQQLGHIGRMSWNFGQCIGFLNGLTDTVLLMGTPLNPFGFEKQVTNNTYCLASKNSQQEIEERQIVLVVRKYLEEHPEKLHLLATQIVIEALKEAFPCQ